MRLYLDDIRDPKGKFDFIARDSVDAIMIMIENGCPNFISFDHDLGGDDTAMKVIKWMVEQDMDSILDPDFSFIPDNFKFFVHSANPVGKENIESYLNSYLKQRG